VNNEFGKLWKEVVMAQFKVQSQHFLGGAEENHKNLRVDGVLTKIQTRHL
jgi:hypothetical protein